MRSNLCDKPLLRRIPRVWHLFFLGVYRFEYIVESIDGDYAHLRRMDIESDELKLVARALLPPEIMEGTKLLYEWMQYSIME